MPTVCRSRTSTAVDEGSSQIKSMPVELCAIFRMAESRLNIRKCSPCNLVLSMKAGGSEGGLVTFLFQFLV